MLSRRPTGFLDIPLEIRRHIYQYCLVRDNPVKFRNTCINEYCFSNRDNRDGKISLLLVSRQIGLEALEVLYHDNVFQICLHEEGWSRLKDHFTEVNTRKIRKMQIVIQPCGLSYGRTPNYTPWSPILASLTKLSIVAQQPLSAHIDRNAPWFQERMETWKDWLRAVLQCIASQLQNCCIVEVDDDDKKEASDLMKLCFPSGYRKVQTLAGDVCFKRYEFFEESDYWDNDYAYDPDRDTDTTAS